MALSLFVYHVRQLDKNTNLLQSLVDQMSTDTFHVRNVTDVDVLVALIHGQKQHILDTFQFNLTDQLPPGLTAVAQTTRPSKEVCAVNRRVVCQILSLFDLMFSWQIILFAFPGVSLACAGGSGRNG